LQRFCTPIPIGFSGAAGTGGDTQQLTHYDLVDYVDVPGVDLPITILDTKGWATNTFDDTTMTNFLQGELPPGYSFPQIPPAANVSFKFLAIAPLKT